MAGLNLQNLPEPTRKKIFILAVVQLMITIVGLWLITLNQSLKNQTPKKNQNLEILQNDLFNLFKSTGDGLGQIKNELSQEPKQNSTSSIEISPQDLEQLKQKIIENSNK